MELDQFRLFGLVVVAVWPPLYAVFLTLFFLRRDRFPIKQRLPDAVLLANAFACLFCVVIGIRRLYGPGIPCGVVHWVDFVTIVMVGILWLFRVYALWYRAKHAEELLVLYTREVERDRTASRSASRSGRAIADSPQNGGGGGGGAGERSGSTGEGNVVGLPEVQAISKNFSFASSRSMVSSARLLLISAGLALLMLLPPLVWSVLEPDTMRADSVRRGLCFSGFADGLVVVYVTLFALAAVFIGRRISAIAEVFNLREEQRWAGRACMAGVVLWVIWLLPKLVDVNRNVFPFSTMVAALVPLGLLAASVVRPLYLSYAASSQPPAVLPGDMGTLSAVLQGPALDTYRAYCVKEYNGENLMLWEEVERFRRGVRRARVLLRPLPYIRYVERRARTIWDEYVRPDAPMWANLPDPIVSGIRAALAEVDRAVKVAAAVAEASQGPGQAPEDAMEDESVLRRQQQRLESADESVALEMVPKGSRASRGSGNGANLGLGLSLATTPSRSGKSSDASLGAPLAGLQTRADSSASAYDEAGTHVHLRVDAAPQGLSEDAGEDDALLSSVPSADGFDAIFDAAQSSVYHLMMTDSFPRFVASAEYQSLATEAAARQQRKEVLARSGMSA